MLLSNEIFFFKYVLYSFLFLKNLVFLRSLFYVHILRAEIPANRGSVPRSERAKSREESAISDQLTLVGSVAILRQVYEFGVVFLEHSYVISRTNITKNSK